MQSKEVTGGNDLVMVLDLHAIKFQIPLYRLIYTRQIPLIFMTSSDFYRHNSLLQEFVVIHYYSPPYYYYCFGGVLFCLGHMNEANTLTVEPLMNTKVITYQKLSSIICQQVLHIVFSNSTSSYNALSGFRFLQEPLHVCHVHPQLLQPI